MSTILWGVCTNINSFLKWGNWGIEQLYKFPKNTQPVSDNVDCQTQAALLKILCS